MGHFPLVVLWNGSSLYLEDVRLCAQIGHTSHNSRRFICLRYVREVKFGRNEHFLPTKMLGYQVESSRWEWRDQTINIIMHTA